MASVNEFTFHLSPLATNPAPRPDQNPSQHLLPPQPIYVRQHPKKQMSSIRYSRDTSPRQEVDVTLGNSPQFSEGQGPTRPVKSISHFNKKMDDSKQSMISSNVRQIRNDNGNSPSSYARSRSRDMNTTINKEDSIFQSKGSVPGPYYVMTERERRGSQYGGIQTDRLRESSSKSKYCEVCNQKGTNLSSPKNKIKNRQGQLPRDQQVMIQKMAEIRAKMNELQSVNGRLTDQLSATRQKLKAKEAECNLLRSKNEQYSSLESSRAKQTHIQQNLQHQVRQLKQLNQQLCMEIEELKKKVTHHQSKNNESLGLLQKLYDNIAQNQKILQKELNQQKLITASLAQQKNRLQIEYSQLVKRCQNLEQERTRIAKATEELVNENMRLGDLLSKSQEKQLRQQLQDLRNQLRAAQYQAHKAEEKSIIVLNELRMKQEDYDKLSQYTNELKNQKAEIMEMNDQDKIKAARKFERQIFELKTIINNYKEDIEKLTYENKELQMKVLVQNEQNEKNLQQIQDLKMQIKTLQKQKNEFRNQCNSLSDRCNKLAKDLEYSRERQVEFNNTVSSYQRDLLQTQQSVKDHLQKIADLEYELNKLRQVYQGQKIKNERLTITIQEKNKIILNLEENLKKQGKVVLLYKEGLTKLQEKKESEWSNMNKVYIEQIKKLEQTIKQLMEYNESKRMSRISSGMGGGPAKTLSFSYQSSSSPRHETTKKVEGGSYVVNTGELVEIVESEDKYPIK